METALQLLISGAAIGSVYGLVAVGFLIIHHATGIVNFAQGQMLMVGTIATYVFVSQMGMSYWIAIPLVALVGCVLALVFNFALIVPLERRKASAFTIVVATIAFGTVLEEGAALLVGDERKGVPPIFPNTPITMGGVSTLPQTLVTMLVAWALVGVVWFFFNHTLTGIGVRAVGINRVGAAVSGVKVPLMTATALVIAIVITVIAGLLVAPTFGAGPRLGLDIGVRAFAAAILGGFSSVYRGMIAGILIGVLEVFAAFYISSAFAPTIAYAVLLITLAVQPFRSDIAKLFKRRQEVAA